MALHQLIETIEQYFLTLITGRPKRQKWDWVIIGFLFFCSRFYRMVTQFRIWLYDKRIVRNRAIGCLVVSIGNLSCGGTGKTPVVEVFARTLHQHGRKVAILSRGYRSKKRTFSEKIRQKFSSGRMAVPPKVVSDGKNLLLDSAYAGDEPYMLARNLSGVVVLVDKDRVKSGLYAIDEFETDTLILDDGFQYLRLKPHINIVLVDSTSPFGNHHVLPRGTLREPVKNLRRADYIFLTKSDGSPRLRHLKAFLRRHNRRAEIIECCHMPQYLEHAFDSSQHLELEQLRAVPVAAISAIANPASFEAFLSGFGAKLTVREHFADHHRYTEEEIINFARKAKAAGAQMIVTTEKDAVRIPRSVKVDLPIYFLRIKIDILSGQENFDQCIARICFL